MKILYDHQIFTLQKFGGISRYFAELISTISQSSDTEVSVSLLSSENHYARKHNLEFVFVKGSSHVKGLRRLNRFINQVFSTTKLIFHNNDIFHPTFYETYHLPFVGKTPIVLTIFDMINEKYPSDYPKRDPTPSRKKRLAERADKIIAISESTKCDIIDILKMPAAKIEVIYLASSLSVESAPKTNLNLPENYILFVGSRSGYKNFKRFLNVFAQLVQQEKSLSLICVGGGAFTNEERAQLKQLEVSSIVQQQVLHDGELPYYYSQAKLFVFPSLYEGFGIPVLEAFACGCPLVCSNTSSLPEIASEGAEYFDPLSEESMFEAIRNVLTDQARQKELVRYGHKRGKEFSWAKCAEETLTVYRQVAK